MQYLHRVNWKYGHKYKRNRGFDAQYIRKSYYNDPPPLPEDDLDETNKEVFNYIIQLTQFLNKHRDKFNEEDDITLRLGKIELFSLPRYLVPPDNINDEGEVYWPSSDPPLIVVVKVKLNNYRISNIPENFIRSVAHEENWFPSDSFRPNDAVFTDRDSDIR